MEAALTKKTIVRKYGGTSVATLERIHRIAAETLRGQRAGLNPVLVVSAMSGETNRLLALAQSAGGIPDARELDVIAATGEQVSAALTAIAIRQAGGRARSFLAHQLRVLTDAKAGDARIRAVETKELRACFLRNEIPVIAGFQGVDAMDRITTLGRGGSDTTAVAISAALGGTPCEIYTDVKGVYTADPGVCPEARKLDRVSYPQMLELAGLGAKVLHPRSVALAEKYAVPLEVRSSFHEEPGTQLVGPLEASAVTSLACDKGLAQLRWETDFPRNEATTLIDAVSRAGIRLEALSIEPRGVVFVLRHTDIPRLYALLPNAAATATSSPPVTESGLARVSLVGHLLQSEPRTVAAAARLIQQAGIPIEGMQTTETSVSFLVSVAHSDEALRALHRGFELEKENRS
jgi:aspartate kinase